MRWPAATNRRKGNGMKERRKESRLNAKRIEPLEDDNVCNCSGHPYMQDRIEKIETEVKENVWPNIRNKVNENVFYTVIGVAICVFGLFSGAVWLQGSKTLETVQSIQISVAGMSKDIETNRKCSQENEVDIKRIKEKINFPEGFRK